MITFTVMTLVAAIVAGLYFYTQHQATIQIGMFPGIMVGSSFTGHKVEYKENGEDKIADMSTLQFSLIFIMLTIVWMKR